MFIFLGSKVATKRFVIQLLRNMTLKELVFPCLEHRLIKLDCYAEQICSLGVLRASKVML